MGRTRKRPSRVVESIPRFLGLKGEKEPGPVYGSQLKGGNLRPGARKNGPSKKEKGTVKSEGSQEKEGRGSKTEILNLLHQTGCASKVNVTENNGGGKESFGGGCIKFTESEGRHVMQCLVLQSKFWF